ncbi:MAG: hypothetical protein RXR20_21275, partial [Paraburkholderia sp.]
GSRCSAHERHQQTRPMLREREATFSSSDLQGNANFFYKANIYGASKPCYLTSREVAGNVTKGLLCTKKKQVARNVPVSFTQHGLKLKISHEISP